MSDFDIPVKCSRCRHQCMESNWIGRATKIPGLTEKVCPKCGCRSYYDMRPQLAWCWASGLIELGSELPAESADGSGAILIAKGPKSNLHGVLAVVARHGLGKSVGKFLVPGVPEASDQAKAIQALDNWLIWCAKGNGKKSRGDVEFIVGA